MAVVFLWFSFSRCVLAHIEHEFSRSAGATQVPLGAALFPHPQGELLWEWAGLGGSLLQSWQQTLLGQVSLQGVEDVELLISTKGQELLDHLARVGAPERK